MRVDKNDPWQFYDDFWDWLRLHPLWIISLFFAYYFYLISTEDVKRY